MPSVARPALAYFLPVFAVAFGLGAARQMLVAPITGPLVAVALEVPVILILSWWVAGRVLRRWPLPLPGRLAMGALAFALLMLTELGLALAFGQTPRQFLTAMTTLAGTLGLAGQMGFALIPALHRHPAG